MNKIVWLLVIGVALFCIQGRAALSESALQKFVTEHNQQSMREPDKACERLGEDAVVESDMRGPRGREQLRMSREEYCGMLREAAPAFRFMNTRLNYSNLSIERGPFPWLRATVSYDLRVSMGVQGAPTVVTESREQVMLVRSVSGLKINQMLSTGRQFIE